jgi:AraC family transcriptional regulator of adaptative response/methylated-DNA-[protein]-cysteine methyltransferase
MNMSYAPMMSPDPQPVKPTADRAVDDYAVVRRAVAFISEHWRTQPDIEAIAHACGVTPDELHHLFRRWAGLTPKEFVAAITLDHARKLLRDSASVLDATYAVGLSGPGRLHDLFVTHEGMSPGEWKAGGEGLTLVYGFHPSPFGIALVASPSRIRAKRKVRSTTCDGAGRGRNSARTGRALRRSRTASSIPSCGKETGRCAS